MILKAIIIGLVQGFTLILPVSNSGHLALIDKFFSVSSTLISASNTIFALLVAAVICVYCRNEFFAALKGVTTIFPKLTNGAYKQGLDYGEKLLVFLLLGSAPLIPLIFLMDRVAYLSTRSELVAVMFIINGIILIICDKFPDGKDSIENSDYQKPFFIGLFQVFGSALPGVSRTGSTVTGGLFFGYNKKAAAKFALLLSVPTLIGYSIINFEPKMFLNLTGAGWTAIAAGAIAAIVSAFLAVKLFMLAVEKSKLSVFSVYCFILGITLIVLAALK